MLGAALHHPLPFRVCRWCRASFSSLLPELPSVSIIWVTTLAAQFTEHPPRVQSLGFWHARATWSLCTVEHMYYMLECKRSTCVTRSCTQYKRCTQYKCIRLYTLYAVQTLIEKCVTYFILTAIGGVLRRKPKHLARKKQRSPGKKKNSIVNSQSKDLTPGIGKLLCLWHFWFYQINSTNSFGTRANGKINS